MRPARCPSCHKWLNQCVCVREQHWEFWAFVYKTAAAGAGLLGFELGRR